MENSEEICTKLLHHGKMIAAANGNMVVTVTSGNGFFGLTLRENKREKDNDLRKRRGAVARQRRTAKRMHERTSGYESGSFDSSSSSASGEPPPQPPEFQTQHPDNSAAIDSGILGDSLHELVSSPGRIPDSMPTEIPGPRQEQQQDQLLEYLDIHYKEHLPLYLGETEESKPPELQGYAKSLIFMMLLSHKVELLI